jgi:phosphotransferase system  glucose/maltose/N-acetylglucosamine-specific IIC component
MNRFVITGGFIGFVVIFVSGVMDGRNILLVLRDSMIACMVMAFLFRMLYRRIEASMAALLEKEWREKAEQARADAKDAQAEARPEAQAEGKQVKK